MDGFIKQRPGDLFLLAGPCVIESEQHAMKMAHAIAAVTVRLGIPYVFKASYDKANRSSGQSFRGLGMKEGLRILRKVKSEIGVPVVTDVHESAQVAEVAEVADILQIPAFLCRQTDLLDATGGQREYIEHLARAGVACGVDGLFMEVHDNPAAALSDATTQFELDKLEALLETLLQIHDITSRISNGS